MERGTGREGAGHAYEGNRVMSIRQHYSVEVVFPPYIYLTNRVVFS
jgi:hypothetical protein